MGWIYSIIEYLLFGWLGKRSNKDQTIGELKAENKSQEKTIEVQNAMLDAAVNHESAADSLRTHKF